MGKISGMQGRAYKCFRREEILIGQPDLGDPSFERVPSFLKNAKGGLWVFHEDLYFVIRF